MEITTEVQNTVLENIMGPNGGLFALGILIGMFMMHIYMTKYVVKDLKERIRALELANKNMDTRIQSIAFDKMAEK